jgi:hypothetical protein
MRKGCRASKNEKKCPNYSYELFRCKSGLVPATCSMIAQPKPGTKKAKAAECVRSFYDMIGGRKLPMEREDGIVSIDELYGI